ncbi:MAG: sigma-70 family RNA polymerase sigma factor [Rhizobacter sp.]|nr:sigma-70 family RNA polymerase sigma factor [Chlorobiales bacterium]
MKSNRQSTTIMAAADAAETDFELAQRVLAGAEYVYAELIDRHKHNAMTLALRLLQNNEDAEEAVQDAFVRVFRGLENFAWKSSFATWLYRIVYNVCTTRLMRRSDVKPVSLDKESDAAQSLAGKLPSEDSPQTQLLASEVMMSVQDEIARLPKIYSVVATLFFLQEQSYDEIASIVNLPLGTVKAQLFRARTLLQEALTRRHGERLIASSTTDTAKEKSK